MKTVALIGDSIRMGYQQTVRELLGQRAEVWTAEENGGGTFNLLVLLHVWVLNKRPDIVHINAGLHDIKTIYYGGRESIVPVDIYRRNVRTILTTIRERTSAKVIWATTTPVRDEYHHRQHAQWNDFDRYDVDVVAANEAANEVCAELGVAVNDLYAVASEAGLGQIQTDDGVHFLPEGSAILGRAVAGAIERFL